MSANSCRSLNRSPIHEFEKLLESDPDSKIVEQEQSQSLKMLLRPLLLCTLQKLTSLHRLSRKQKQADLFGCAKKETLSF